MREFTEPIPTRVELPSWLTEFYEQALHKDLQKHEGVCPHCHGLGWEVTDQRYGISNDTDRGRRPMFPYHNQYIIPCRHCYTGVIHYCEHCGKELPKGSLQCDCEAVKQEDRIKEAQKEAELLERAEKFPASTLGEKFGMCYSDYCTCGEGYFSDWESFFEEWDDRIYDNDGVEPDRPKYVLGTDEAMISIDASDIVERATEDLWDGAYDQISEQSIDELQGYIDKWCAQQFGTKTYLWTHKYAVEIPWEEYDGRRNN